MLNYSFWTSSLILEIKKTCHWSSFQDRDQSSRDLKLSIWYKMSLWTVISKSLNTVSTINLFYHEQNSFLILRLVIRMRNRLMSFLWDQFYEVYPLNLELKNDVWLPFSSIFDRQFLKSYTSKPLNIFWCSHSWLFYQFLHSFIQKSNFENLASAETVELP